MVDDAHASGVLGEAGRGSVNHFGLDGRVAIQVGTLSKAVGVLGGYVAGSQALRDILVQRARPFLFSTSHPPSVAASCREAIRIMQEEPELHERLWANTRRFKAELGRLGFDIGTQRDADHARASWATARPRSGSPTGCSTRACSRRRSCSPPSPWTGRGSGRSSRPRTPTSCSTRRWRRSIGSGHELGVIAG